MKYYSLLVLQYYCLLGESMSHIKRFGKPLSWRVNVVALGTKGRQKLSALIVLGLAAGALPPAAHALKVQFFIDPSPTTLSTTPVYETADVSPPSRTLTLCGTAPCTGVKGYLVTVPIVAGTYGGLQILAGARGEAKIETSATTINTSATINNTLNVVGTFRMSVPGQLRIVTSSDFNLRDGTTTSLNGGGTWQALGRGASKCEKTSSTGPYQNSLCVISDATVDSANYANDCTLCRSYGYTDTGHVLRPDGSNIWQLPATGVVVTMTSDVKFLNAAGTVIRTEPLGLQNPTPGQISYTIPPGSLTENGRFYINLSQNELVPCEPFGEPCQNSERKSSTLRFANMQGWPSWQVVLPATSTDVAGTELGVVLAQTDKQEIPIDLQPIDPVADPANPGFFLGGDNNDSGQGNSQGNLQVVAFETPRVKTCEIVPFDGPTPMATLSVAGSPPVPFTDVSQYSIQGVCVGLKFTFDRGAINDAILGDTDADKLQTCMSNPIATLVIDDSWTVDTEYELVVPRRTANYASEEPGCNVVTVGTITKVVCSNVSVQVFGSQGVKCATPAGG